VISAKDVSRRFGERLAVDQLTFDVKAGEVFGLLGPNGAGKTTTLRMLGGLILPSAGSISIDSRTFTRAAAGEMRAGIGFLTETPGLWDHLSVLDNLLTYARLFGVASPAAAAERTLRTFELWDRRNDRAVVLSKGMKQKLALARALVHDPKVVLLDEPTANLDPQMSRAIRDLLRGMAAEGCAIVVSSHNLDEVERVADRVALINGRLMAIGAPAALRRDVFGRRLRVRFATNLRRTDLSGSPLLDRFRTIAEEVGARDVRDDGDELSMAVDSPDTATPAIVRALVHAGAEIREVFDEQAALEDVYLRLLDGKGAP
jgi:ABC-2 type transport system ATP-binding protein